MDCMDCHNRPSHLLGTPDDDLDAAMSAGRISAQLPNIKEVAFATLVADYETRDEAERAIAEEISAYYRENYPSELAEFQRDVERAVSAVQQIYRTSVFPYMNAGWGTYPQNVSHKNFPGCFRCHDGQHVSDDGQVLVSECTLCHSLPQRSYPDPRGGISEGLAGEIDWHIWPLEGRHAEIRCDRCHNPTRLMRPDCAECHQIPKEAPHMSSIGCAGCHPEGARALPRAECESCHRQLLGLHQNQSHAEWPCTTCHPTHSWLPSGRPACLQCHPEMDTPEVLPPNLRVFHEEKRLCWECHRWDIPTGPEGFPGEG
jgi:hypothetical protein